MQADMHEQYGLIIRAACSYTQDSCLVCMSNMGWLYALVALIHKTHVWFAWAIWVDYMHSLLSYTRLVSRYAWAIWVDYMHSLLVYTWLMSHMHEQYGLIICICCSYTHDSCLICISNMGWLYALVALIHKTHVSFAWAIWVDSSESGDWVVS